jgi:hypothetical protein
MRPTMMATAIRFKFPFVPVRGQKLHLRRREVGTARAAGPCLTGTVPVLDTASVQLHDRLAALSLVCRRRFASGRRRGWVWATVIAAYVVGWSADARASPQARLVYGRGGAGDSCPDEHALRRAVAARIGYDPFFPFAPRTVVVSIAGRDNRIVAHVLLIDDQGHAQGERELASKSPDCSGLFDTVALTISIAIDPHALERVGPPVETVPSPAEAPSTPAPPPHAEPAAPVQSRPEPPSEAEHPAPPPATSPRWRVGAAFRGSLGLLPALAAGASLNAGMAWSRASVDLEVQGYFPASKSFASASSVTVWLLSGALVPCLRVSLLDLCALAVVGRLDATASNVTSARERVATYVGLGARVALVVPLAGRISFRAEGDVLGNLDPMTVTVGTLEPWKAPPVGGTLALGVLTSF